MESINLLKTIESFFNTNMIYKYLAPMESVILLKTSNLPFNTNKVGESR